MKKHGQDHHQISSQKRYIVRYEPDIYTDDHNCCYILPFTSKEKLQKQINRYIQKKNNKRSKNKLEKWSNILWVDLLKKWEEIIIKQNFDEDLDMRRYRTSLWYKVLNKEA